MANSYTWTISALDVKPQVGSIKDYVVTAHWRCEGTDGNEHFGSVYSTASFVIDEEKTDFIPFNQLKESDVIGWVQSSLTEEGVNATYAGIDSQIENQINPPIITPPLPWNAE